MNEGRRSIFSVWHVGIVLGLAALTGALVTPEFLQRRANRMEVSAIGSMKTIATAQRLFHEGDAEHDGNLDYGMLSELGRVGLIDPELAGGTKDGYVFQASYSFTTSEFLWFAAANPNTTVLLPSGKRSFAINQNGYLFHATPYGTPIALDTVTCLLPRPGFYPASGK